MRTKRLRSAAVPHVWCLVPGGPGEAVEGVMLPVVLAEPVIDVEDDDAVVAISCHPVGLPEVEIHAPLGAIIDETGEAWDVLAWLDAWTGEAEAEPSRPGRRRA